VEVLGAMLEDHSGRSSAALTLYVAAVLETLHGAEGGPLFEDALKRGARAAWHIAEALPDAAKQLCRYVEQAPRESLQPFDYLGTLATAAGALTIVDRAEGRAAWERALAIARQWRSSGYDVGVTEVTALIRGYSEVSAHAPEAARTALDAARGIAEPETLAEQIQLDCAYASALSPIDPAAAAVILHEQLRRVRELAAAPPGAPHLQRMIAEFTGRLMGPRVVQGDAIGEILHATLAAAAQLGEDLDELLHEILAEITRIDSGPDRAQALASLISESSLAASAEVQTRLAPFYREAIAAAAKLPEPYMVVHALQPAAALAQVGLRDEAELAVRAIPDEGVAEQLQTSIEATLERAELGELSRFERTLVDETQGDMALAVVHAINVEGTGEETLEYLLQRLADDEVPWERSRLLGEFLPLIAAPARAVAGTGAVIELVERVEDFDQRLRDAARLVGAATDRHATTV
jgi:hypothetical protein